MQKNPEREPTKWGRCGNTCPYCYENRTKRANHKHHKWYTNPPTPFVVTPWEFLNVQRPQQQAGAVGAEKPLPGAFLSDFPNVWAYLTDSKWDDGSKRERATILVIADGGVMKLWLGDKACKRSCWVTGESLEQAFTVLEEQLATSSCAWRPMDDSQRNRGRRG